MGGFMKKKLSKAALFALGFVLIGALNSVASAQTAPPAPVPPNPPKITYILAGKLIAKTNAPILNNQTILVSNGKIMEIRAGFVNARGENDEIIDLRDKTIMAGLIDSHVHITHELGANSRLVAVTREDADWGFEAMLNARKTLDAGFTTIADMGADGGRAIYALRDRIAKGDIIGPRIIAAGNAISASGGHGDIHGYREDIMHLFKSESICNGADDCLRATRQQIHLGSDIVKVTATGGVLSNTAAGLAQQLEDDELKAIASAAHSMGRQVTAHAHSKAGIEAALRAGFDSIEHGSYLDNETIALFKAKGAYLVPTVLAGATVVEMAAAPNSPLSEAQKAKARQVGPLMLDMLKRAHNGGVKIAFGTDSGVSKHGQNARELELMVQAGFTPLEALHSATIVAAEHLGIAGETGTIEVGKAADIIAIDGDPTKDISIMRNVKFVMARGVVAKR